MSNKAIPFYIEEAGLSGKFISLSSVVDNIVNRHENYNNVEKSIFGKFISLASLLTTMIKTDGAILIEVIANGYIKNITVEASFDGKLRGFLNGENVPDIIPKSSEMISLFKEGVIAITIDQGKGFQPYKGIIEIKDKSFDLHVMDYFNASQQTETFFKINSSIHNNKILVNALMIQKLPYEQNKRDIDSEKETWELCLSHTKTLKDDEMESFEISPEEIIYRLYNETEVIVYNQIELVDQCRCSKQKFKKAVLLSYPSIEDVEFPVEIFCNFCNRKTILNKDDF